MGIESDQVVYEYLSRVGDVAQQRQLPSGARMRLVSELRNEIDRHRARTTADTPAAVRRILDGIGSPDDVVAARSGTGPAAEPVPPPAQVPVQRDGEGPRASLPKVLRRAVPRPRVGKPVAPQPTPVQPAEPHQPHQPREAGEQAAPADWWRVGGTPLVEVERVPGFTGGIEIPELLHGPRPPEPEKPEAEKRPVETAPAPGATVVEAEAVEADDAGRRRFALPLGGWSNPLLLLAAVLLVVGAALGNWIALLLGWLIAYTSRRLTQNESKFAVLGLPGLAVAGGLVWLWGRSVGRWGDPIAEGHMNDAVTQTWPWVVRGAAVLSALFVLWRSQRRV
ncbi:hypothetical protein [Streptomyces sp. NPDC087294]|uniref:hypothetical protein n=1 Tax=Streptomyces sp. NPDC087294 TaxID=3365777 RepID=UPI00382F4A51